MMIGRASSSANVTCVKLNNTPHAIHNSDFVIGFSKFPGHVMTTPILMALRGTVFYKIIQRNTGDSMLAQTPADEACNESKYIAGEQNLNLSVISLGFSHHGSPKAPHHRLRHFSARSAAQPEKIRLDLPAQRFIPIGRVFTVDDLSVHADHIVGWKLADTIRVGDLFAHQQKTEVVALPLEVGCGIGLVPAIDSEDLYSSACETFVQCLHLRHEGQAWSAPTSPEVENDNLASKLRQRMRLSARIAQRPIRRCGPRRKQRKCNLGPPHLSAVARGGGQRKGVDSEMHVGLERAQRQHFDTASAILID